MGVKLFDLLIRDFYRAEQDDEEELYHCFLNKWEGLFSRIREKIPDQIPLQEYQRFLRDRLFFCV